MNDELKETLFGDIMFRGLMLILAILVGVFVGIALSGCTPKPPAPVVNGVSLQHNALAPIVNHLVATSHPAVASIVQSVPAVVHQITQAPADLKPVSYTTNVLVICGIILAAFSTGAYFFDAALHKAAIGAGVAGIALSAYSLFVHTTLWIAPYVSGALVLFAVGVGVYETIFYLRKQAASATASGTTVTPVAKHPFPDLATKVVTLTPNPVKKVPVAVTPPNGIVAEVEAEVKKVL